jgi:hypothetical protein
MGRYGRVVERRGYLRRGGGEGKRGRRGHGFSQMRSDRNRNRNTKTTGYMAGIETPWVDLL